MNRKIFIFFLLVLLVSSCCVFVFADDEIDNDSEDNTISVPEEIDTSGPAQVVVDITHLLNTQDKEIEEDEPKVVEVLEPQLVDMDVTKVRVSPSDTTGLKAVLLTILGDYETVVTDYTYQQNNYQYMSHSIQIERDYAWICSCCIFAILLYCTFRTIGGICARF